MKELSKLFCVWENKQEYVKCDFLLDMLSIKVTIINITGLFAYGSMYYHLMWKLILFLQKVLMNYLNFWNSALFDF